MRGCVVHAPELLDRLVHNSFTHMEVYACKYVAAAHPPQGWCSSARHSEVSYIHV